MTTPLTHFVLEMDPEGPGPTAETFSDMWGALRALLVVEMKRRSSWLSPPSYLGVVGHHAWTIPGSDSDALEELAAQCFEYVFIRRLGSLRIQTETKPSIDGLVVLAIRHFLLEAQRRSDPLGFRVYEVLQRIVRKMLETERLFLVSGDERIRNDTLLAMAVSVPVKEILRVDPSPLADRWSLSYLEELVTASHKALTELIRTLGAELVSWLGPDTPGFRFGDLAAALKDQVRSGWSGRYLSALFPPIPSFEERTDDSAQASDSQSRFEKLARCVTRTIADSGGRKKTRAYLSRLWSFLEAFAADRLDLEDSDLGAGRELPSGRQLSKILDIPRERIPGLLESLRGQLRDCRQRIDSFEKGESMASPPPTQSPRERALASARAAHAKAAQESHPIAERTSAPFRRGDILTLPDAEVPGVHWLLLSEPADGGLSGAPVDTFPFVGPTDVPLPARETQQPWVLRRRFELPLGDNLLARATLVDHLDSGALKATLAEPDLEGCQVVDDDLPSYREWIEEGPRAAYERLRAKPLPFPKKPTKPSQASLWLAAAMALVALGLGIQVARLGSVIELLSEPVLDLPYGEVKFESEPRGPRKLAIPRGSVSVQIGLILQDPQSYPLYRIELAKPDGRLIYRSPDLEPKGQYTVTLPVRSLRGPSLISRLYGLREGKPTLLSEQKIEILEEP